jgi:aryl-alcohol dehydrogenase-like predicted oxidoreductase
MQNKQIPHLNKPVSQLVQGTVMLLESKLDESLALLDAVYALGCNTFDTAQSYNNGSSERVLGQWLARHQLREQVVIITKGAHPSRDRRRVTPFDITADLHDSLARLKTDYIDLYLLHRDDPDLPVGPIVEVLNEHLTVGRIRAFGGSNWTTGRIAEANAYAAAHGLRPFTISSPNFSLAEQVEEPWPDCVSISGPQGAEARAWYGEQAMPLFTWSSLAGGFFSGRFRRDNLDEFDDYLDKICVQSYCYEDNFRRLERAEQLASEKALTLPQIALAFVLNQPLPIQAIVGCRSGSEFAVNMTASEIRLTQEEMDWLDLKI